MKKIFLLSVLSFSTVHASDWTGNPWNPFASDEGPRVTASSRGEASNYGAIRNAADVRWISGKLF